MLTGIRRALILATGLLVACGADCGDRVVKYTLCGRGTVSVTLSAVAGEGGTSGSGSVEGWDPTGNGPYGNDVDSTNWPTPGGWFVQDTQIDKQIADDNWTGPGGDGGAAFVALERTDTTLCEAAVVGLHWGWGVANGPNKDTAPIPLVVSTALYDADGQAIVQEHDEVNGQGIVEVANDVTTLNQISVASGALTVEEVDWTGFCGTSALSVEWAFDETDPYEMYAIHTCWD